MAPLKGSVMEFSHLSDQDLEAKLAEYGITVGPVNVATRATYERRLYELQTGHESPTTQQFEPVEDDDEGVDEEVQFRLPQDTPTPQRPVISHPEPGYPRMRTPDVSNTSRVEGRIGLNQPRDRRIPSKPLARPDSQSRPPSGASQPSENRGIPLWVKLIAFVVVVALIYLIYSNMEQNTGNSIPGMPKKVEV